MFSIPSALKILIDDYNRREFIPIMEADWAAHLYHAALRSTPPSRVHLQTRIAGQPERVKYDFVIGSETSGHRPTVSPECVCEIKCFVRGFDFQQCQAHVHEIIHRDLPKLARITRLTEARYELIFDEIDHLSGGARQPHRTKLDRVVSERNSLDRDLAIVLVRPKAGLLEMTSK